MNQPSAPLLDIIIPVWNDVQRIQDCLSAVLESIDEHSRLILIKNGCDYAADQLIDRFSDFLGERAVVLGLERAATTLAVYRHALQSVEAPWVLFLPTSLTPTPAAMAALYRAIETAPDAGLIGMSPNDTPVTPPLTSPCCESEQLPGEPLAINMAMHRTIGCVNDLLWGTPWLGQEYARRANRHGFRSYLIDTPDLTATPQPNLGSRERFQQRFEAASAYIRSQWGQQQHLALYLTAGIDSACIHETTQTLLQAAREGLTVSLILHPRDLRRPEIATLTHCHHGITTTVLPRLMATRAIKRHIQHLRERPVPTILGVIGPLTAVPASCGEWLPADQALDLARNQRSTHEHVHSQSA